ncbi:MAG: hypothetical protein U0Y10_16160 [Spirosomataceae bacterium]
MVNWLIYGIIAGVLVLQGRLLLRNKSLSRQRLFVKGVLNGLLAVVLIAWTLQPTWKSSTSTNKVLIVTQNIAPNMLQRIQDSLQIEEVVGVEEIKQQQQLDPTFIEKLGQVFVVGQDVDASFLSDFGLKKPIWIPYYHPNQIRDIRWQGVIRKGELQHIEGQIEVTHSTLLRLKYGKTTLDSLPVEKGIRSFVFRVPSFVIGRCELELWADHNLLQPIRFYSRPNEAIHVKFLLESPDFESKILAEWLGKNGHTVEINATISKSTLTKVTINQSVKDKIVTADILITDPSNASNPLVKKAVSEGKSILFLGVQEVESSLKNINQAVGTHFNVSKISNEAIVPVGNGLTALPFEFSPSANQQMVAKLPIAIQQTGSKIGVCLLNETFSLQLGGDSLNYQRIWANVFQLLLPVSKQNVSVSAPIYPSLTTYFTFNAFEQPITSVQLAYDTLFLKQATLNTASQVGEYVVRKKGWQPLADSLEFYAEEELSQPFYTKQAYSYRLAQASLENTNSLQNRHQFTAQIPDWAWFFIILLCLTLLWIEPKF